MAMDRLLELMAQKKASDLFLAVGSPVQIKLNGITVPVNQNRLDPEGVETLLREIITERQWQTYENEQELNIGYGLRGVGSFRFSVFRQRGSTAAVIRYIPGDVPTFDSLELPPVLRDLIMQKRGLILVVGATGSGKTTTLASLIDYRNEHKTGHILTLEDPIEFTFRNKKSIVNQRQIGTDTASLKTALKNALRQAPDCILIGEIRDTETMSAAIAYAQSGHLVLATLHANNASHALNRIVSFYSPENRRVLLSDLSTTLKAVISQRLIKSAGGGRLPAVEVLLNTNLIAELIEQGRLSEIREAMINSMTPGAQTFEQALIDLLVANRIGKEDALANSDSPTNLLWLLENRTASAPEETTPMPAAFDLSSTLLTEVEAGQATQPAGAGRAPARPVNGGSARDSARAQGAPGLLTDFDSAAAGAAPNAGAGGPGPNGAPREGQPGEKPASYSEFLLNI